MQDGRVQIICYDGIEKAATAGKRVLRLRRQSRLVASEVNGRTRGDLGSLGASFVVWRAVQGESQKKTAG
jgi:hypothetical protein